MIYKVENLTDDTYQVLGSDPIYDEFDDANAEFDYENPHTCYQGSLSDCNAWLSLNDKGYLEWELK